MAIQDNDIEQDHLHQEIETLRGELEQARVALEDMDQRITELTAAKASLAEQLQAETRLRQEAQMQLRSLTSIEIPIVQPDTVREDALRAQLSNALEELHVMAEELSLAQEELQQANNPR